MKLFFFLLLLPLFSVAQLIHVKDKEIIYEGTEKINGATASEMAQHLQNSFWKAAEKIELDATTTAVTDVLAGHGSLKMKMPYHKDRLLHFDFRLQANAAGYTYRIDSLYVVEKRRGWDPERIPGKDLVKNMEETGTVAAETERILNEIDLRLQKLLALLRNGVSKAAGSTPQAGR